jgi:hypothetical protein
VISPSCQPPPTDLISNYHHPCCQQYQLTSGDFTPLGPLHNALEYSNALSSEIEFLQDVFSPPPPQKIPPPSHPQRISPVSSKYLRHRLHLLHLSNIRRLLCVRSVYSSRKSACGLETDLRRRSTCKRRNITQIRKQQRPRCDGKCR